jgi:hypothetical protein
VDPANEVEHGESEQAWMLGKLEAADVATDNEGEQQSFASLFGAETDEEPEIVEESLMVRLGGWKGFLGARRCC